jgi:tRNA(Ile)-lysidine synthase
LINDKVPQQQRQEQLVLTTAAETVLWVVGHKFAWLDESSGAAEDQECQIIVVAQRKC